MSRVFGTTIEEQNYSFFPEYLPRPIYNADGIILWFPYIVGGTPAALGDFPGQVYVMSGVCEF